MPQAFYIAKQYFTREAYFTNPAIGSFLAEGKGFDLRCGAGHLGLKRAPGAFPSALGFESYQCQKEEPSQRDGSSFWRRVQDSNPRGLSP